jgi:Flp pilus assembly protein TadG
MTPTHQHSTRRPFAWLRNRSRDENGAAAVIVAVCLVALLGFAALALDLASFRQARQQAQSAADAAALAGMQDLPTAATAQTTALSYVAQNDPGATPSVTTPYKGDNKQIRVSVSKTVPTILGGILGITGSTVSASAAAKQTQAYVPAALFANNSSCSGASISFDSNNAVIAGGSHSNGTIGTQDNSNRAGVVTYGGPNHCGQTMGAGTYTSLTPDYTLEPWPKDYSTTYGVSAPTCTSTGTNRTLTGALSGVYCATGTITLTGTVTGTASFVASAFSVSGITNRGGLTPYSDNLLLYQTGSATLSLGNLDLKSGWIFAPNALVNVGQTVSTSGFIEADKIDVTGGNFTMTGTGPLVRGAAGALSE